MVNKSFLRHSPHWQCFSGLVFKDHTHRQHNWQQYFGTFFFCARVQSFSRFKRLKRLILEAGEANCKFTVQMMKGSLSHVCILSGKCLLRWQNKELKVTFPSTMQQHFCLEPKQLPPAGQEEECRLWSPLHFSLTEATGCISVCGLLAFTSVRVVNTS